MCGAMPPRAFWGYASLGNFRNINALRLLLLAPKKGCKLATNQYQLQIQEGEGEK